MANMAAQSPVVSSIVDTELWMRDPAAALSSSMPSGKRFLWNNFITSAADIIRVSSLLLNNLEDGKKGAIVISDICGFNNTIPEHMVVQFWKHLLLPLRGKLDALMTNKNVISFLKEYRTEEEEMLAIFPSSADRKKAKRANRRERSRQYLFDTIKCLDKNAYLQKYVANPPQGKESCAPFFSTGCIDFLAGYDRFGVRRKDRPPESIQPIHTTKVLELVEKWLSEKNLYRTKKPILPDLKVLAGMEKDVLMNEGDGDAVFVVADSLDEQTKPAKKGTPKSPTRKRQKKHYSQLIAHNGHNDATMLCEFNPDDEKLIATSAAYPIMSKYIEKKKLPLDVLFPSEGKKLYEALEAANIGFVRPKHGDSLKPIKVDCRPLISNEFVKKLSKKNGKIWLVAPFVVGLRNALSPSVKNAYVCVRNNLPCCKDIYTGAGNGLMRASFRPENHVRNPLTPVVNLHSKSIQSVVSHDVENAMLDLFTKLSDLFYDKTMEIIRERHDEQTRGCSTNTGNPDWTFDTNNMNCTDDDHDHLDATIKQRSPCKKNANTSDDANDSGRTPPAKRRSKRSTKGIKSSNKTSTLHKVKQQKGCPLAKRNQRPCAFMPRVKWNLIMSKMAEPSVAKYDSHQDYDPLLVCPPLNTTAHLLLKGESSDSRFPFREEMSVATLCLGGEKYTAETKITWSDGESTRGALGHLITDGNAVHFQSPFTQYYGIEHSSAAVSTTVKGSIGARLIDSFRDAADPNREHESYCAAASRAGVAPEDFQGSKKNKKNMPYNRYEWTKVMEHDPAVKLPADKVKTAAHWWEDPKLWVNYSKTTTVETTAAEKKKAKHRQNTAKASSKQRSYKDLPASTGYSPYRQKQVQVQQKNGCTKRLIRGVPHVLRTIGIGHQSRKEILRRSKFSARSIRDLGRVLLFQDKNSVAELFQPVYLHHGRPIPSGHKVGFRDIPELHNTKYATDVIDKENQNKAVLSFVYKNQQDPINQHAQFFSDWNEWRFGPQEEKMKRQGTKTGGYIQKKSQRAAFQKRFNKIKDLKIEVGGGGGSAQPQGQYSFSAESARADNPTHVCGGHQKVNNHLRTAFCR